MATGDLGACEWFVWDLRRSNLIDRGQLDQTVGEFLKKHPRSEPPQLAEYLVGQGILTQFQADRILQGKTQGLVLGPYTLTDSIGTGSMGTVYKALSKTDNKWYAVKVLPRRSMWNVRLARRQVRQFEQFTHQAVVPFVDVGTSGGLHYLAWPLIDGESLEGVMQRETKLAPEVAALYALQTATGLHACHTHGIFHGLIKPSNLILGSDGQVRVLDFGIGSLLAENEGESLVDTMSTANTLTSGLDCASPESIMEPTNRTASGDQYSLGCCLYYFMAGQYPFPEESAVQKMMAHQYKPPKSVKEVAPNVPDELAAIAEKLMQKKPEDRYASCEEVVEALRPFAAAAPAPAKRPAAKVQTGGGKSAPADNGAPAPAPSKQAAAAGGKQAAAKGGGGGGGGGGGKAGGKSGGGSAPAAAPSGGGGGGGANADRLTRSLRENMRPGAAASAAPAPTPKRELPPEAEDEDEDETDDDEDEDDEEEEGSRFGPIAIIVGALLLGAIAFYMALKLFGKIG